MADIGLFEAIHSARSLRRLKPDPVPDELITQILEAAICAPSAGNAQNWAFVVVRDAEQRRQLGLIYRKASDIAEAMYAARGRPPHLTDQQFARMLRGGAYLWDHLGEAPVLLIPCQRRPIVPPREALPPDIAAHYQDELAYADRIRGASIYPAVQNILLACRGLGLGRADNHQPHSLRGRGQGTARHSRRCRHLRVDADRLATRQVRAVDPATARRSRSFRPLGQRCRA